MRTRSQQPHTHTHRHRITSQNTIALAKPRIEIIPVIGFVERQTRAREHTQFYVETDNDNIELYTIYVRRNGWLLDIFDDYIQLTHIRL